MIRSNSFYILIILIGLNILIRLASDNYIVTNKLIEASLRRTLNFRKSSRIHRSKRNIDLVNYFFLPLYYLIKTGALSLWILSATIFIGYRNSFQEIFRTVIIAEFVWLIPSYITLTWFGFIDTGYSLLDVQYFELLSLLNFFNASEIESWIIFPLQSLNLFEIAYMFILAIGIKKILRKDYMDVLNFTVSVYGTALVTWIVFITLLGINLTA